MKKMMFVALTVSMASMFAASAFAEGKQLTLAGGVYSSAELNEKNIAAGYTFLGSPRYSVIFTIEPGSSGEESASNLTLQGEIAAELFDNMAKAGLPLRQVQLGQAYSGQNIFCSVMTNAAGGEHHVCTISLK
jgi:hypothetical protein